MTMNMQKNRNRYVSGILIPAVIAGILGIAAAQFQRTHKHKDEGAVRNIQKTEPGYSGRIQPHKALYDIDLVGTRSGAQLVNVGGQMFFEWRATCEAWVTDHRFNLVYEYSDTPSMQVTSDFSTYEALDGRAFHFSARRSRNGERYEEIRGSAEADRARYTKPDGLTHNLPAGTLFPMGHTLALIDAMSAGKTFFNRPVFDGSDTEGPVEVSAVIGPPIDMTDKIESLPAIDGRIVNSDAHRIRMAFFPLNTQEESADYEMDAVLQTNGIVSDMLVEYKEFSVRHKLVALEALPFPECGTQEEN